MPRDPIFPVRMSEPQKKVFVDIQSTYQLDSTAEAVRFAGEIVNNMTVDEVISIATRIQGTEEPS